MKTHPQYITVTITKSSCSISECIDIFYMHTNTVTGKNLKWWLNLFKSFTENIVDFNNYWRKNLYHRLLRIIYLLKNKLCGCFNPEYGKNKTISCLYMRTVRYTNLFFPFFFEKKVTGTTFLTHNSKFSLSAYRPIMHIFVKFFILKNILFFH